MVDPNQKGGHLVIIILLSVVIALGIVVLFVQKCNNKKNIENLERNYGIINGSANSNGKVDESDDSIKQNLVEETANWFSI